MGLFLRVRYLRGPYPTRLPHMRYQQGSVTTRLRALVGLGVCWFLRLGDEHSILGQSGQCSPHTCSVIYAVAIHISIYALLAPVRAAFQFVFAHTRAVWFTVGVECWCSEFPLQRIRCPSPWMRLTS